MRRVAFTRMPTKWGMFQIIGFEREIPSDSETALAIYPRRSNKGHSVTSHSLTMLHRRVAPFASLRPAGVICEIVNDDGTMARVPDLIRFCRKHGLLMITVADLARYRFDCDYEEALAAINGILPVSARFAAPCIQAELIA